MKEKSRPMGTGAVNNVAYLCLPCVNKRLAMVHVRCTYTSDNASACDGHSARLPKVVGGLQFQFLLGL